MPHRLDFVIGTMIIIVIMGIVIDRQHDLNSLVEVELPEGCVAAVWSTWRDFASVANGKIVWITEDVFVDWSFFDSQYQDEYTWGITVCGGDEEDQGSSFEVDVCASSIASTAIACDILRQLVATCEPRKITLAASDTFYDVPVSAFIFSHFLLQSSHSLKVLCLRNLRLNEYHCHAIDASTRTDLQSDLDYPCALI